MRGSLPPASLFCLISGWVSVSQCVGDAAPTMMRVKDVWRDDDLAGEGTIFVKWECPKCLSNVRMPRQPTKE